MIKTRFDIESENLDLYFASIVPTLTGPQKEKLPRDVSFKLFRKGGEYNTTSSSKLGFIARLVILWKCLRKRIFIVVEDDETGLSLEDYVKLRDAIKKQDVSTERASGWIASGTFITGSKELCDTFSYLNLLSASPAYNYLLRSKNKIPNKTAEWKTQMAYITKFLVYYESNKKKWVSEIGLQPQEWYVLLCLYPGNEVVSSSIYKETFRYAYQSSRGKIKAAFSTLQIRGYVTKTGHIKGAKLKITPMGTDIVSKILSNYALNC